MTDEGDDASDRSKATTDASERSKATTDASERSKATTDASERSKATNDASERSTRTGGSYVVRERVATPDEFQRLRDVAGMTSRSREGVERGLPNSTFGVVVEHDPSGDVVGMGRIVGDDGSVYHVCDMAVHPDHQRQGLGTRIMNALVGYVEETAPPDAYVNCMADVDGFYERFGFEETRPASKGMYRRTE